MAGVAAGIGEAGLYGAGSMGIARGIYTRAAIEVVAATPAFERVIAILA